MLSRHWPLLVIFTWLAIVSSAKAQIYADVTLAGGVSGTFRITLEHTKAPVAVANFIGLATGQNAWIDPVTGRLRNDPFYNGLTFHRVIAGFVSQTGSRNGMGTDGPGYTFANEIDSSLSHGTTYTVAMANSGGAFSNGAQFYITAAPRTENEENQLLSLDRSYTIFGRVTSGTEVCDALNAVPTNSSVPITPVTISSISISGPSLTGFNLQPLGLPRVTSAKPVLKINGASYSLGYDHLPFSAYFGSNSANLGTWNRFVSESYFHASAPAAGDIDVTSLATGGRQFFQLPRVDYSLCYNPLRPSSVASRTFSFPDLFETEQLQLVINAAGTGGTYSFNFLGGSVQSGTLAAVSYIRNNSPYGPYLYVLWDNGVEIIFFRLEYITATGGKYVAQTNVTNFTSTSGTFTSTP